VAMIEREYQVQILKTPAQWESGLRFRLNEDKSGLSLFATPSFQAWLDLSGFGGDIVTDECGQTWWIAKDASSSQWTLFRNDPYTKETERLIVLHDCDDIKPRKLWLTGDRLLLYDEGRQRILGISRENLQVTFELSAGAGQIDIDFDGVSAFQALTKSEERYQICMMSLPPAVGTPECLSLTAGLKPVAIATGPGISNGDIYLFDSSAGQFLRFRPKEGALAKLDVPSEVSLKGVQPSVFQIDSRGVLFLASSSPAKLWQFDKDGCYICETRLPSEIKTIAGIGFDGKDGVYLATNHGLARFSLNLTPVGQSGIYYAPVLDNGEPEGLWHQLEFSGSLPPKTSVEVSYHASGESALVTAYKDVLAGNDTIGVKKNRIENLLGPFWNRPASAPLRPNLTLAEVFRGALVTEGISVRPEDSVHDMLFLHNKGRYLYLKLVLTSFDEKNRPEVRTARISYPRKSYLRYLPPVYSEDAVSAAFLERFLCLFETIFQGLEQEITNLFKYFDPCVVRKEFLPWLSSWINLAVDENLPDERQRELLAAAPEIFSRKGTPYALTRFLEIYTGKRVTLVEHSGMFRPMVLGTNLALGLKTILVDSGRDAFRLGDSSILGQAVIRAEQPAAEEALLPFARRFSIFVDMDWNDFNNQRRTLRRIIDEQKPAHTVCSIGTLATGNRIGIAQLEINTTVSDRLPYRVGFSPLGEASAVAKGAPVPRMERGSWVGGAETI
jgi:phage tail-like protein